MGMSPMPRMSHPPGQMQSPLNHTISDLNVSNLTALLSTLQTDLSVHTVYLCTCKNIAMYM